MVKGNLALLVGNPLSSVIGWEMNPRRAGEEASIRHLSNKGPHLPKHKLKI